MSPRDGTRGSHAMGGKHQNNVCTNVVVGVIGSQISQKREGGEGGQDREGSMLLRAVKTLH